MAYVNKEQSKKVKEQLQAKFPKSEGWEFSVSIEHHSTLNVAIMRAPVQLIESKEDYEVSKQYENFNVYHLNNYVNAELLNQIKEIANAGNFDNSDLMTDYHHVGFYLSISAGKWNKPFVYTGTPEAAEKAIVDFIEAEVAKKGLAVTTEGAEGAIRFQFSEKGIEREIFVAEPKPAEPIKPARKPRQKRETLAEKMANKQRAETSNARAAKKAAADQKPATEKPATGARAEVLKALIGSTETAPILRRNIGERTVRHTAARMAKAGEIMRTLIGEQKQIAFYLPPNFKTPETAIKAAGTEKAGKVARQPEKTPETSATASEIIIGLPYEFTENGVRWTCLITQVRAKKVQVKICGEVRNLKNKPAQTVRWVSPEQLTAQLTPKTPKAAKAKPAPRLRLVAAPVAA